ncbi:4-(cytidine 5'-diphospho)-2-C-methyl-D-erythritol kinase [Mahella australiensis]|uniref:4-diphosphocytidyl-2-C-methyl-D-erythritol kinase n=1 Tax=Mahella australiensis (strain DSM 15567 / CIP 107919 / 50-1 BON) TaxID=697281 RepID=F4A2I8_MAHA5|nr:4-(cytidine 5'-diphospho)-2-C-methyl-D-erythritol kinase [Mahella australiensis]AEE97254.1 4-diphosphocytidyl-2C-methyl-D-erythritolkinase [Mahella australiensis 50-1 BON]
MIIIEKANAKINLFLDIIGRRQDGYHLLKMIMHSIPLYDTIEIDEADNGIILEGSSNCLPWDNTNLAYKAAEAFCRYFNVSYGARIYIDKRIPVAAGLAGGSSDAAAVLRGLNKLWGIKATVQELRDIALTLGADVPYCVEGGTVLAEGIGENLIPLKALPQGYLVLITPPIAISTSAAYKEWDGMDIKPHAAIEPILEAIERKDLRLISKCMFNTLEIVALKHYPIIDEIKNIMFQCGCLGTCMSGSGPSVFGIFDSRVSAVTAVDRLKTIVSGSEVFLLQLVGEREEIC